MMLRWWRRRRRARILAAPFPEEWRQAIERDVALWAALPEDAHEPLLDAVRLFVAERYWEPCGGLELTEPMCAVIAAQASIPALGRSVDIFDHVRSILVYPDAYCAPDLWEDEDGIVTEGLDEREGEAWEWGTVVLSWRELLADARRLSGRNLVLHEMAHQIDLVDVLGQRSVGTDPDERALQVEWLETFLDEYERFVEAVDRGRRVPVLDPYGAEDEAEFFAVASESFFERGASLRTHHPRLYAVLSGYYHQDPASWPIPRASDRSGTTARQRRRARRAAERRRTKSKPN